METQLKTRGIDMILKAGVIMATTIVALDAWAAWPGTTTDDEPDDSGWPVGSTRNIRTTDASFQLNFPKSMNGLHWRVRLQLLELQNMQLKC